jgi:hypothetical protein
METAAARTASTSNNPEDILIQKEAKNDMLTQLSSISIHLSTEEKGRLKMIYAGEDIPTVAFQKLVSVIKKHI